MSYQLSAFMTLRRCTPFVLVTAFVIAACSSTGEPSWSLTSSTSDPAVHGLGLEDRTGTVLEWEFAEDADSWADIPNDFRWGIRQSDPKSIEVGWWGLGCDDDPRIVVDSEVIFTDEVDVHSFTLNVIEPPA